MTECHVIFTLRVPMRLSGHDEVEPAARKALRKQLDSGRLTAEQFELDDIRIPREDEAA